jgi:hypothetical protein
MFTLPYLGTKIILFSNLYNTQPFFTFATSVMLTLSLRPQSRNPLKTSVLFRGIPRQARDDKLLRQLLE